MSSLSPLVPRSVPDVSAPTTWIESSRGWASLRLTELFKYRELFGLLIWRDIKIRYKETVLGVGWVVIQPVLTMAIFSLFFGKLAKVPSDDVPYPLFSLAGLVPWMFFANSVSQASNSLLASGNLIKKVYFPRLILPAAVVVSGLIDLALSVALFVPFMAFYGVRPTSQTPFALAFLALAFTASLGAGLWLAALNVKYRDVRHVLPFLIQLWMFATPVAYPSSLLSARWRALYGLNPMVGVIEGFRWSMLSTNTFPGPALPISAAVSTVLLLSGAFYFRRAEKSFADVL